MVINMNETKLRTIGQLRDFLRSSTDIEFSAQGTDDERYAHISHVLKRFSYPQLKRPDKSVVRAYLARTSGYSLAQLTRLIRRWSFNRLAPVPLRKRYGAPTRPFAQKYTREDIALLVEMDRAHESTCGPAIAHLLRRAYTTHGDARYERLAGLSVSHLYNLRHSAIYKAQRIHLSPTRSINNRIGQRKAPAPEGRVGFVRIDTVHQGDLDGVKGVYHITCVDVISQWQVQACVQGISEAFLLPALRLILEQFPFVIRGFHSDNGSEYINHRVARLLEKLRIEQTKSRSRQSNDNALAESKNASVVRKQFGYAHIPQVHAAAINDFYQTTFNPWLNFHRPCLFATETVSAKGKVVKRYRHTDVKTPLECLVLLDADKKVHFKRERSLATLQQQASAQTDLAATQTMQAAKQLLFDSFLQPKKRA
jgi:transposase InsO family protein